MINWYKDTVVLNCLAGSHQNAKEIHDVANGHALIGVLSSKYTDIASAILDMKVYNQELNGNLSVGLGGGNPAQWKAVGDIAKEVKADHFNQVFTAVAYTRANVGNDKSIVNVLIAPTGTPGLVKISTGPLSSKAEKPAIVDVNTAILMAKDMGGSSLKFFPMHGLQAIEELKVLSKACADNDFIVEPTGGIDLINFEEILVTVLEAGVKKVIPHVYSSIIDKESGDTKIDDVKKIFEIIDKVVK